MNLYIMSRGRAGRVETLKWIPETWKDRTYIVCGKREIVDYLAAYPRHKVIGAPEFVQDYSTKFQYLMLPNRADAEEKCVILDDDLSFSRRSTEKPGSLITLKPGQTVEGLFEYMEGLLDGFPLVGVHPRQMGQNTSPPYVENSRIICIQGINRNMVGNVKVDQYPILADVVLNCTLLARGLSNALITTFFQDHGPCQASGGCSIYRTPDMQRDAVRYLASRFPGYVTEVTKTPKVAKWMGDTRTDYRCQWKALHKAGLAYRANKAESPDMEVRNGNA